MNVSLSVSPDGISSALNGLLSNGRKVQGWLNRYAYPIIIRHQRQRWQSEGASEGSQWAALNPTYKIAKLRRFRDYPGAGTKMLIATNRLVNSVTGDDTKDHLKLVTENQLIVGTLVNYAKYVDEKRSFTVLSQQTVEELKDSLKSYLKSGKE